jgi:hypothetical protein
MYCIHRGGKLSKMAGLHGDHYRFLSSRPLRFLSSRRLPVLELARPLPVLELARPLPVLELARPYRFLSSRPLPVLELAADALCDAAKAESEEKDDEDEDHAAGEEVVPVRRIHHVLIQGQRAVNRSNLEKNKIGSPVHFYAYGIECQRFDPALFFSGIQDDIKNYVFFTSRTYVPQSHEVTK